MCNGDCLSEFSGFSVAGKHICRLMQGNCSIVDVNTVNDIVIYIYILNPMYLLFTMFI